MVELLVDSLLTWMVKFQDRASLDEVEDVFAEFSAGIGRFAGYDVIRGRGLRSPILGGQLMGQQALLYSS